MHIDVHRHHWYFHVLHCMSFPPQQQTRKDADQHFSDSRRCMIAIDFSVVRNLPAHSSNCIYSSVIAAHYFLHNFFLVFWDSSQFDWVRPGMAYSINTMQIWKAPLDIPIFLWALSCSAKLDNFLLCWPWLVNSRQLILLNVVAKLFVLRHSQLPTGEGMEHIAQLQATQDLTEKTD